MSMQHHYVGIDTMLFPCCVAAGLLRELASKIAAMTTNCLNAFSETLHCSQSAKIF